MIALNSPIPNRMAAGINAATIGLGEKPTQK